MENIIKFGLVQLRYEYPELGLGNEVYRKSAIQKKEILEKCEAEFFHSLDLNIKPIIYEDEIIIFLLRSRLGNLEISKPVIDNIMSYLTKTDAFEGGTVEYSNYVFNNRSRVVTVFEISLKIYLKKRNFFGRLSQQKVSCSGSIMTCIFHIDKFKNVILGE